MKFQLRLRIGLTDYNYSIEAINKDKALRRFHSLMHSLGVDIESYDDEDVFIGEIEPVEGREGVEKLPF